MLAHRNTWLIDRAERALRAGLPADPVAVTHLFDRMASDHANKQADDANKRQAVRAWIDEGYMPALKVLQEQTAELRTYLVGPERVDRQRAIATLDEIRGTCDSFREIAKDMCVEVED